MRVQRAPRAADQPQRAPEGLVRHDRAPAVPTPAAGPAPARSADGTGAFSADVDLDLTALAGRSPEDLFAEVVVRLLTACHREGLVDVGSALRVVTPTDGGFAGVRVDGAVDRSAPGLSAVLGAPGTELPPADAGTLTVVDARGSRTRAQGDWGLGGGLGVATLGRVGSAVVSSRRPAGLVLGERLGAGLGLTVPDAARAAQVVRALDAVARSLEGPVG